MTRTEVSLTCSHITHVLKAVNIQVVHQTCFQNIVLCPLRVMLQYI